MVVNIYISNIKMEQLTEILNILYHLLDFYKYYDDV